MVELPMRSSGAMDRQSILSINQIKVQGVRDKKNILEINRPNNREKNPAPSQPQINTPQMAMPKLNNTIRKGQKAPLENAGKLTGIEACLGWNVKNPACDVDVSAFLLSGNKVISDDWFVFYGQPDSPDNSTSISSDGKTDRQVVTIDFTKINEKVEKIVFVLTINEALENGLNFNMVQDAYIRILKPDTKSEIVSFLMDEYYENATSMMIGEIYKHNGSWKFNAIGSGVARDLAGLCELYGVQID